MRFFILIACTLLLTTGCSVLQQNSNTGIPGLVAYYPFNGNAIDKSSNGNDGEVLGATLTEDRFGNKESAMLFDGNSSIIVPSSESLNFGTSDFAISLWFKAINNGNEQYQILRKGNDFRTLGQGRWVISLDHSGRLRLVFEDSYGGNYIFETSEQQYLDSEWHHLIAIFDRDEVLSIYMDNKKVLETSDIRLFSRSVSSTNPMKIGQDDTGGSSKRFNGIIDDIRIYNRLLSDVEFADLYYSD